MISVFDAIADELAEHGYAIADQFLSQTEVNAILSAEDFEKRTERFKKAGVGQREQVRINESIRGDYIQWIDKASAPPAISVYFIRLDKLMG